MRLIPFLAAAMLAGAQSQPPVEASAAVNPPPAAGATITVRNHFASPLMAFVFIYTLRSADSTVYSAATGYYDAAADPMQNHPIPPGEEVKLPYYAGNRGMIPVVNIEAALFADGTTFGQKSMVQNIYERRNFTLVTLNKSIAELKQAARDHMTREQLVAQMQSEMNQERMAAGNNDLATCILTVRNQVFMEFLNARNPDGTPMTLDKFLPAEIEVLNHRKEALQPPKP